MFQKKLDRKTNFMKESDAKLRRFSFQREFERVGRLLFVFPGTLIFGAALIVVAVILEQIPCVNVTCSLEEMAKETLFAEAILSFCSILFTVSEIVRGRYESSAILVNYTQTCIPIELKGYHKKLFKLRVDHSNPWIFLAILIQGLALCVEPEAYYWLFYSMLLYQVLVIFFQIFMAAQTAYYLLKKRITLAFSAMVKKYYHDASIEEGDAQKKAAKNFMYLGLDEENPEASPVALMMKFHILAFITNYKRETNLPRESFEEISESILSVMHENYYRGEWNKRTRDVFFTNYRSNVRFFYSIFNDHNLNMDDDLKRRLLLSFLEKFELDKEVSGDFAQRDNSIVVRVLQELQEEKTKANDVQAGQSETSDKKETGRELPLHDYYDALYYAFLTVALADYLTFFHIIDNSMDKKSRHQEVLIKLCKQLSTVYLHDEYDSRTINVDTLSKLIECSNKAYKKNSKEISELEQRKFLCIVDVWCELTDRNICNLSLELI